MSRRKNLGELPYMQQQLQPAQYTCGIIQTALNQQLMEHEQQCRISINPTRRHRVDINITADGQQNITQDIKGKITLTLLTDTREQLSEISVKIDTVANLQIDTGGKMTLSLEGISQISNSIAAMNPAISHLLPEKISGSSLQISSSDTWNSQLKIDWDRMRSLATVRQMTINGIDITPTIERTHTLDPTMDHTTLSAKFLAKCSAASEVLPESVAFIRDIQKIQIATHAKENISDIERIFYKQLCVLVIEGNISCKEALAQTLRVLNQTDPVGFNKLFQTTKVMGLFPTAAKLDKLCRSVEKHLKIDLKNPAVREELSKIPEAAATNPAAGADSTDPTQLKSGPIAQ